MLLSSDQLCWRKTPELKFEERARDTLTALTHTCLLTSKGFIFFDVSKGLIKVNLASDKESPCVYKIKYAFGRGWGSAHL